MLYEHRRCIRTSVRDLQEGFEQACSSGAVGAESVGHTFARPPAHHRHYGEIRAALERIGRPIGHNDLFIAAHARSLGLTMVTDNVREFDRVPDLKVENWLR